MIGASIVNIRTLYRCMDDGKDSFPTALFVAKKQFPMTMELFMEAIFLLTIAHTVELNESYGTPVFSIEESDEWNKAKWDSILNRMIELLDFMDERNPIYDDCHNFEDHYAMRENANEEFFNLFCENFGRFWD